MTGPRAADVVAAQFPERALTRVEPMPPGGRRETATVHFADASPLVVQLAAQSESVATEAALLTAIHERTSVPVPPVVDSGVHDGTPYLLTAYCDGVGLHTAFSGYEESRQRAIARQFGRFLADLHGAFAFEGCGELTVDDGTLEASVPDCRQWVDAYGRTAVDRLPADFDGLRDRLVEVLDEAFPETPPPRLFPWDLRPGNALAVDGEVAAVVDWERPMAAPPALAVAKVEYLVADWYASEPGPLRAAFRDGYRERGPLPRIRPVHRVVAVADSAVDSHDVVTRPGYPAADRQASVDFHRAALRAALSG